MITRGNTVVKIQVNEVLDAQMADGERNLTID
jgi:hypothetical protein